MVSCWAKLCSRKKPASVKCINSVEPAALKVRASVRSPAGPSPYIAVSTSISQAVVVPNASVFEDLSPIARCNSESAGLSWLGYFPEALHSSEVQKSAEPPRLFKPNKLALAPQANEVFVSPFMQLPSRSRPKLVPITPAHSSLKSRGKR